MPACMYHICMSGLIVCLHVYVCVCMYLHIWDMYLNTIFHANGRVGGWISAVLSYCCCLLFTIARICCCCCCLLLYFIVAPAFSCCTQYWRSSCCLFVSFDRQRCRQTNIWVYLRDTCTFAKLVACDTYSILMCTTPVSSIPIPICVHPVNMYLHKLACKYVCIAAYMLCVSLPTDFRVNPCIFAPLHLSCRCIVGWVCAHVYVCMYVYR